MNWLTWTFMLAICLLVLAFCEYIRRRENHYRSLVSLLHKRAAEVDARSAKYGKFADLNVVNHARGMAYGLECAAREAEHHLLYGPKVVYTDLDHGDKEV